MPDADPAEVVARVAGDNRIATAVAASKSAWDRADRVVVATGRDYADALAGGALAAERAAPLLLTERHVLPKVVADEIGRLGATSVWLLGGESAISADVERQIADLGVAVHRVAGADRFDTAAKVAGQVHSTTRLAALALGRHPNPARAWPDAVAAGALAATSQRIPTLLTTTDVLPPATEAALQSLGVRRVYVVGGPASVSSAVTDRLGELGYEVERLSGPDRYATSAAVAAKARTFHEGTTPLVLASGANYADALPAGALAARLSAPLLLAPPCALEQSAATASHVERDSASVTRAVLVGGEVAVSERVRWQVGEHLRR